MCARQMSGRERKDGRGDMRPATQMTARIRGQGTPATHTCTGAGIVRSARRGWSATGNFAILERRPHRTTARRVHFKEGGSGKEGTEGNIWKRCGTRSNYMIYIEKDALRYGQMPSTIGPEGLKSHHAQDPWAWKEPKTYSKRGSNGELGLGGIIKVSIITVKSRRESGSGRSPSQRNWRLSQPWKALRAPRRLGFFVFWTGSNRLTAQATTIAVPHKAPELGPVGPMAPY